MLTEVGCTRGGGAESVVLWTFGRKHKIFVCPPNKAVTEKNAHTRTVLISHSEHT